MDHRNLPRVDTPNAIEAETALAPHIRGKTLLVGDVREDRGDRLNTRRSGSVDRGLPGVKALPSFSRTGRRELRRQIFETEGEGNHQGPR